MPYELGTTVFFERHHVNKRNNCKLCLGHGCASCDYTGIAKPDPKKDGGINTIWTGYGSAMKYFRWSHEQIMNMSFDNYMMYMVSIPTTPDSSDTETGQEASEEMDLFNMDAQ